MADEGYNGWKNYPTWCVNMWWSNDQGWTREILERTEDVLAGRYSDDGRPPVVPRVSVADMLKDFAQDFALEQVQDTSMMTDLLAYALDQVDWLEIADAWIEMAGETVDA